MGNITKNPEKDQRLQSPTTENDQQQAGHTMAPPPFQLKANGANGGSDAANGETVQKKDGDAEDPLKVTEGQLTFDSEGNDDPSSPYFTRKIHYPPVGDSGVTLGRGYDFGNRTQKQVRGHLTQAGFSGSKITTLLGAVGKKGKDAAQYVKDNKTKVGIITHEQQKVLFEIVYAELKADVVRISSKADVEKLYGETDFENLHPAIMEVVVDLRYRGDYKPSTRKWIQSTIAKNDLAGMAKIMADTKWKTTFGVPKDRFERRKKFMQDALSGKVSSGSLTQNSPKEETAPTETETGTPIGSGTIKADGGLRVRNGIGTSGTSIVRKLANGSQVDIYETKNGWHRIGVNEWVHGGFVTLAAQETTEEKETTTPAKEEDSGTTTTAADNTTADKEGGQTELTNSGATWDKHTNNRIGKIHPEIQAHAREFINRAKSELGIKLRVTQGLRTFAEQDALYAKGRTAPGGKVTNAKGGQSWHNYGLAIDVVEITAAGQANWNADWAKIGALGESVGFEWGGRWTSIVDKPHFQMNFGLSISEARALYNAKGGNFIDVNSKDAATGTNTAAPEAGAQNDNTSPLFERVVNTPVLNVRSGPGTSNKVVSKLNNGSKVQVYQESGAWLRIGDGQWIHGNFVTVPEAKATEPEPTPAKEEETPAKATTAASAGAAAGAQTFNYSPLVRNVYDAMFGGSGFGTDEDKVYRNLSRLNNDDKLIAGFKKAYAETYSRDVVADIKSEFSDNWWAGQELTKALGYLNMGGSNVPAKPANTGGSDKPAAPGGGQTTAPGTGGQTTTTPSNGGKTTTPTTNDKTTTTGNAPAASGNEMVDNTTWTVVDSNAIVRDEKGAAVKVGDKNKTIPAGTQVSIVADKRAGGNLIVQVKNKANGKDLGWTSYSNLSTSVMGVEHFISQAPGADKSYRSKYASWTACRYVSSEMVGEFLAKTNPEMKKELGITDDGRYSLSVGGGNYLRILYEDKSFRSQTKEEKNYKIEEALMPHAQADEAFSYIDGYLAKGVPLVVGVDHTYNRNLSTKKSSKTGTGYNEGTTDHFITLTGVGKDPETGKKFYSFFDPGRTHKSQGTQGQNKLVEESKGKYVAKSVGSSNKQTYHLAMVVLFPSDRSKFVDEVKTNSSTF